MVPDNQFTAIALAGAFQPPDDRRPLTIRPTDDTSSHAKCLSLQARDWDLGGVALNNTSAGLSYQVWEFRLNGANIEVGPESGNAWTTLRTTTGDVTEVVGTFDTNMSPIAAWVEDGIAKLRYFDSSLSAFTVLTLTGATHPRLCLDDRRTSQLANADALLFYVKAGGLYWRQQRDRFQTEYYAQPVPPNFLRLGRCGMSSALRVQVEFLTSG